MMHSGNVFLSEYGACTSSLSHLISFDSPSPPPSIPPSLRYLDGSTQVFQPEELDVVEMMSDMHQHAHVINAKYEDEGKELEA